MLERLAVEAPGALAGCLPDVVPRVSECMVDAKDQVKVRARGRAGFSFLVCCRLLSRACCRAVCGRPASHSQQLWHAARWLHAG